MCVALQIHKCGKIDELVCWSGGSRRSADKTEEKLDEHLRNSQHARKEWSGLGLKLSTSAPYRICVSPDDSVASQPKTEEDPAQDANFNTFTILLSVDGVELKTLKRFEVARLISGPPGTRVNVSVARVPLAAAAVEQDSFEAVDLTLLRALPASNKGGEHGNLHHVPLFEDSFFGVQLVSSGSVREVLGMDIVPNTMSISCPEPGMGAPQPTEDASGMSQAPITASPYPQPESNILFESIGAASTVSQNKGRTHELVPPGPTIGRIKARGVQLLARVASARLQGYKISAEKELDKLAEHLHNSREVRSAWCSLGWKLSATPPYRIVAAAARLSSAERPPVPEELAGYNILLVVEGVPVGTLKLAELQTLFSGCPYPSLACFEEGADTCGCTDMPCVSMYVCICTLIHASGVLRSNSFHVYSSRVQARPTRSSQSQ